MSDNAAFCLAPKKDGQAPEGTLNFQIKKTDIPAASPNWTRPETLAAMHVYLELQFGQIHRNQPKIKEFASWIGRTPSSVALKLVNFAS